jgi:outer membrane receptor protein involved in Fe transport
LTGGARAVGERAGDANGGAFRLPGYIAVDALAYYKYAEPLPGALLRLVDRQQAARVARHVDEGRADRQHVLTADPNNIGFSIAAGAVRSQGFEFTAAGQLSPSVPPMPNPFQGPSCAS